MFAANFMRKHHSAVQVITVNFSDELERAIRDGLIHIRRPCLALMRDHWMYADNALEFFACLLYDVDTDKRPGLKPGIRRTTYA